MTGGYWPGTCEAINKSDKHKGKRCGHWASLTCYLCGRKVCPAHFRQENRKPAGCYICRPPKRKYSKRPIGRMPIYCVCGRRILSNADSCWRCLKSRIRLQRILDKIGMEGITLVVSGGLPSLGKKR